MLLSSRQNAMISSLNLLTDWSYYQIYYRMAQKYRCLLLVILAAEIACSHFSSQGLPPLALSQQLQFQNTTGRGLTEQQLSSFIEIANYASSVYGEDLERCTRYIKLRMDALYGIENYFFTIFIQSRPSSGGRYVWVNHDSVFAGLAGINRLFPQWSYFFSRNYGSNEPKRNIFIKLGQRGKGVTEDLYSRMERLIRLTPEDPQCLCPRESLASVSEGLREVIYGGWSIICTGEPVTQGITLNYQDLWISAKVRECHYTIYNN